MSEDVPTFGRENLEPNDQPTWDFWADWHALVTDPDYRRFVPHNHRTRVPGCVRCDLSTDEVP